MKKQEFQIELKNRFEALCGIESELDIDSEWENGKTAIKETCEKVLGKKPQQNERLDVTRNMGKNRGQEEDKR